MVQPRYRFLYMICFAIKVRFERMCFHPRMHHVRVRVPERQPGLLCRTSLAFRRFGLAFRSLELPRAWISALRTTYIKTGLSFMSNPREHTWLNVIMSWLARRYVSHIEYHSGQLAPPRFGGRCRVVPLRVSGMLGS
jgi:hypothetical protein